MSVYSKLQQARAELQKTKIKATGFNSYSDFSYLELADFLPKINEINNKIGIATIFSIVKEQEVEIAKLTVVDCDGNNEKIEFTTPTAEANVGKRKDGSGGAQPIQNLGGKITYLRRYLLVIAYEIVEQDIVDGLPQENKEPLTTTTKKAGKLDQKTIDAINACTSKDELKTFCSALKANIDKEQLASLVEAYNLRLAEIDEVESQKIADDVFNGLEREK